MFQEMAEALPPGQIRAHDLEALGLPDPGELERDLIAGRSITQAEVVTELANEACPVFPLLRKTLRDDVSLPEVDDQVWVPGSTAGPQWGTFKSVGWVTISERSGSQAKRITDVSLSADLFGLVLIVAHRDQATEASLRVALDRDTTPTQAAALAAYVRGLGANHVTLRELVAMPAPISPNTLVTLHAADVHRLSALLARYRSGREEIDGLLGAL